MTPTTPPRRPRPRPLLFFTRPGLRPLVSAGLRVSAASPGHRGSPDAVAPRPGPPASSAAPLRRMRTAGTPTSPSTLIRPASPVEKPGIDCAPIWPGTPAPAGHGRRAARTDDVRVRQDAPAPARRERRTAGVDGMPVLPNGSAPRARRGRSNPVEESRADGMRVRPDAPAPGTERGHLAADAWHVPERPGGPVPGGLGWRADGSPV
ncbi:hypothetical protein GCM10009550_13240 [Actinocorallia libanotica]|uniref:Uncharacterized protein n=1 Tax=Actinocorallia libanotica TaxID=46162 RepID=A0ABN1QGM0_9ACTN